MTRAGARYDPTLGDAGVAAARTALAAGEFASSERLIDEVPAGRRPLMLLLLADPADMPELPGPASASPVQAGLLALRRWWLTTGLERLEGDIAPTMYRHAAIAARHLATIPASDLPSWYSTVALAIETDLGAAHAARADRFREIIARQPEDVVAWLVYLRSAPFEEAVAAVDEAADGSDRGSFLHAFRVIPHVERWRATNADERAAYFTSRDVRDVVLQATTRFNSATSPDDPERLLAHSILAWCVWRVGKGVDVRPHLKALDGRWTFFPWGFLRSPEGAMDEVIREHGGLLSRFRRTK